MIRTANEIEMPDYGGLYERRAARRGVCGYEALDRRGYLQPGKVTMVFSRLRTERSALAMNLILQSLSKESEGGDAGVVVFSPHQSGEDYFFALAGIMAGNPWFRFEQGLMTRDERRAISAEFEKSVEVLKSKRLYVEDRPDIGPDAMVSTTEWLRGTCPLRLVVVDQLQDIDFGGSNAVSAGWGVVGSRLSRIARACHVPVLVLSGCPFGARTYKDVFWGYGSLHEYVDFALSLNPIGAKGGPGREILLMRPIGSGSDCGVEFEIDPGSLRVREVREWNRNGSLEAPRLARETDG